MKNIFTCLLITSISLNLCAQVGLEGIVVERFYVSDEADSANADENFATYPLHAGTVTYRVYANLLPDYKVIQMFGSQTHPLNVQTTTSFYNDPNYGFSSYQGTSVVNTKKNTTLIDSYFTIGGVASGLMGVLKTEDTDGSIGNLQGILANNDATAGSPITGTDGKDGLMPGTPTALNLLGLTTELDLFDQTPGSVFTTSGGTIAALGGVAGVTASNHVLLGQFTTDGIFSFELNLQLATPVQGESQIYVASSPVGDELTDPTLTYVSQEPEHVLESKKQINHLFNVFPNPCDQVIRIARKNSSFGPVGVSVLDITGRTVMSSSFSSAQLEMNTEELSSGVYLMELQYEGGKETVKFRKN